MADALRPMDGVVWDLDGTLIDSDLYVVENYVHMYRKYRPGYFPHLREILGFSGPSFKDTLTQQFPKVPKAERESEFVAFSKRFEKAYSRLYPGELACLKTIKAAGIKQLLVTNKGHAAARADLDYFGLSEFIDDIISFDDPGIRPKPDPSGTLEAVGVMKTAPSRTIIIGDSDTDLLAGAAAGIKTGLVTWSLKGLPTPVRDHEFDPFREIEEYLTDGQPSARDRRNQAA